MSANIIVYGHSACPSVPFVRSILERSGAVFEYINIHTDEVSRARLRDINNGYESVPTLVFPDGSTLTEPSMRTLREKLAALGYEVQPVAWKKEIEKLLKRVWMPRS